MTQADQSSFQGFQGDAVRDLAVSLQTAGDYTVPLLETKLFRPPVSPDLEPRGALLEHLSRNRQRPLTLILAPAGYGKTTLASMWLEAEGCPGAWVSLDEGDNDLGTFTSYLVAAVQRTLRTSNGLERLTREIRRRSRVAMLFPNEASCLRLVTAVVMEISEDWQTGRVYLRLDAD